jgi:hypothetical protein
MSQEIARRHTGGRLRPDAQLGPRKVRLSAQINQRQLRTRPDGTIVKVLHLQGSLADF